VQAITAEPVIGATYEGTVKSTTAFGAFVEIMPGTEGLVHISELKHGRTEKTEDVVKKGDHVRVKLLDRDERGRLRLSMKALQEPPAAAAGAGSNGASGSESSAPSAPGGVNDAAAGDNDQQGEENGAAVGAESTEGNGDRGDRPRRSRGGRGRRS